MDAADCVGPDWSGSAWVNSTEPLAIAVDVIGQDGLTSYTAVPAELRYAFDQPPLFTEGSPVAYGPLIYGRDHGWDTSVHVQNLSSTTEARVQVVFLDAAGAPVAPAELAWICPRGSRAYTLTASDGGSGPPFGSVRAQSLQGLETSGRIVGPPNISAVVEMVRDRGRAPGVAAVAGRDTLAYNLLSEEKSFDWPTGRGWPGVDLAGETGLIAIPTLLKDAEQTGVTTALAIANLVPQPGATNIALLAYDQNGLVGALCRQLRQLEVAYIDVGTWNGIAPGFRGSALISAAAWRHPVYGPAQAVVRNPVGLAAVVVQRGNWRGTSAGDLVGDLFGATTGTPVRRAGRGLIAPLRSAAVDAGCPPLPASIPTPTPDLARPIFLPHGGR